MTTKPIMTPDQALELLKKGNETLVAGNLDHNNHLGNTWRCKLEAGQSPYATILACSDSRCAPEHAFNAGFGDIFVCRNAGNVVDEVILGSIEYAALHTGCPLLVVMGHSLCGAITATVGAVQNPGVFETPYIDNIIKRLLPGVLTTREDDNKTWVEAAARQNVENTVDLVLKSSKALAELVDKGDYKIVGAYQNIVSGKVEFFV